MLDSQPALRAMMSDPAAIAASMQVVVLGMHEMNQAFSKAVLPQVCYVVIQGASARLGPLLVLSQHTVFYICCLCMTLKMSCNDGMFMDVLLMNVLLSAGQAVLCVCRG
jgi:hypothetical protein